MSESEDGEKTVLILQTHGIDQPKRTYAPLFYAMTASAMDLNTKMWYTMEGSSQLEDGAAKDVQIDPDSDVNLRTMIDRAMNAGVEVMVCHQSMDLFDLEEEDLIEDVDVVGAASIIDLALDADLVMYF